jgi:hypothetical protein
MKRIYRTLSCHIFILALACIALAGCETSSAPGPVASTTHNIKGGGRLVILRAANMGTDLTVNLKIDGKVAANIILGGQYNAPLAAGPHVLTVLATPNRDAVSPTQTHIVVKPGQTYTFTAMWRGERLKLVAN